MARTKQHEHYVMSTVGCRGKGCSKKIKQNVIDRKPDAKLCFNCFRKQRRDMVTAREARTGRRMGRAKGRYGVGK